jgi:hypothetical protein
MLPYAALVATYERALVVGVIIAANATDFILVLIFPVRL